MMELNIQPLLWSAPVVSGLGVSEQHLLDQLVRVWSSKLAGNRLRQAYVDGDIKPQNMNIAIPNEVAGVLDLVSGWPEKAAAST